jgi:hypothetical protein
LRGCRAELADLHARLEEAELKLRKATGERCAGYACSTKFTKRVATNSTLREENAKLSEELSAFDLDFFEEIEDLKYKYAEAVGRLQMYEGTN